MYKKYLLIIFLIFLLGTFLRFYQLGENPVSLHRDEVFLGYNAYSILKTGREIDGHFLPLHLGSFLQSPAGYCYFTIPFITLFGLTAFSVRFASAFFGSLTILLVFLLVWQLFEKHHYRFFLSSISMLFLTISPWHINLSRTATENTIVVFFISLGILLYLYWLKKMKWYLLISAFVSFGITFWIYQAPRSFLPLFLPLLIFMFPPLRDKKKHMTILIVLFIIIAIVPLLYVLRSSELSLRIRTVNVFATPQTQLLLDEQLREDGAVGTNHFITRVFHNKLINYLDQIWENYINHFSYNFLFTDNTLPPRYRVPSMGILYLFDLPLLIFGIWCLLRDDKQRGMFLLGWVFLAPVGSSLTFDDVPNMQRILIIFPALSIIAAYGFVSFILLIKKKILWFTPLSIFTCVIMVYSFAYYLHQYYVHQIVHKPLFRQEGYKQLVAVVNANLPSYTKAIITSKQTAPTLFFLFYSSYDPWKFLQETKNSHFRLDQIHFAKYEFSQWDCPLQNNNDNGNLINTGEKGILYVDGEGCKVPVNAKTLAVIRRSDNTAVFRILAVE